MRMLGGNCVLRRAVKNSEKKSEKPLTSLRRVPTRIMLCFAPGMFPAVIFPYCEGVHEFIPGRIAAYTPRLDLSTLYC